MQKCEKGGALMEQAWGINTDLLQVAIKNRGMNVSELSALIGMDPSTFYRKLQAKGIKFTIGQMHSMVDALALTNQEASDIFFDLNSQKCE